MGPFKLFKPGDKVPTSGVYAVLHSTPHRLIEHEAYIEGRQFRGCRACPLGVWYRLDEQCVPYAPIPFSMTGRLATAM
ncbi:MAG: hypothetical protein WBS24_12785 [Terriglobales bacterium]